MKTRLTDILGAEHRSLDSVAPARLEALTAEPRLSSRTATAVASGALYSEDTIATLPEASGDAQWRCLTEALYFEARGESVRGLFGVAEVIVNRVDDPRYPDTVCDVVNDGTGRMYACQFTYTCDSHPETISDPVSWSRVGKVARLMLDGAPSNLTDGATHYHTRAVNPSWASRFPRTTSIGVHHFYRWPLRTASN
jgi:spore germination cell wall hydrolase CwlJ-like protein